MLDNGVNILLLQFWSTDCGPWMQGLHAAWGLGSFSVSSIAATLLILTCHASIGAYHCRAVPCRTDIQLDSGHLAVIAAGQVRILGSRLLRGAARCRIPLLVLPSDHQYDGPLASLQLNLSQPSRALHCTPTLPTDSQDHSDESSSLCSSLCLRSTSAWRLRLEIT